MITNVRTTSILAYAEKLETIGEQQLEVYKTIRYFGKGLGQYCNNRMIGRHLNLANSTVSGRVNELRKLGLVVEYGKKICPIILAGQGKRRLTLFWKVGRIL